MLINKPVAPSNEVLIKSGNKPGFAAPFRIIIHLFWTSFLNENSSAVILNAITTSLARLLENRFESLGDFKYIQSYLIAVSFFQSICKVLDCLYKFSYYTEMLTWLQV